MRRGKLLMIALGVGLLSLWYGLAQEGTGNGTRSDRPPPAPRAVATFAGGCFWCLEAPFEQTPGVIEVISGYTGGSGANATYQTYVRLGHVEAVQIIYDPTKIEYGHLLDIFWRQINPTDAEGQFADRGAHYRPVIFYHDAEQKRLAEASRAQLDASGRFTMPVATQILQAGPFYRAENDHQDYYRKNALRYLFYRAHSGRDEFLNAAWGDDRDSQLQNRSGGTARPTPRDLSQCLTPMQYRVTRQGATEPAFNNEFWNHKQAGIYVDVVSGEPLFSSVDKFDSGTGWPSFTRPLEPRNIVERPDHSLDMVRAEVRSRDGDSHLGHVFGDGPSPTGRRYCINSAALRFIPKDDLEKEGYGQYLPLFNP